MNELSTQKPIAQGRTADVYLWDDTHILKLFHDWFVLENIEYELKIARAVNASGVKSPIVGELVEVEGRNGLTYERIEGMSMLKMFQHRPWKLLTFARVLAQLHAQMHKRVFDADVPSLRQRLQYKLNNASALPASLRNTLRKKLEALPEGDRVCHGDFHPDNVLLSGDDATVIDWIDSSRGNPLADVARTSVILLGAVHSNQTKHILDKTFVKTFHNRYLREYFRLHPQGMDEYHRWFPIVAGARLSEGMPELETWLVEQAGKI